jgi:hypothetical protein
LVRGGRNASDWYGGDATRLVSTGGGSDLEHVVARAPERAEPAQPYGVVMRGRKGRGACGCKATRLQTRDVAGAGRYGREMTRGKGEGWRL